ncbi:fatty-acyl-CoA synthase [Ekhidna lutea]|uniref:Fatty-acyl-CoA synthase n=1 Tax=Ekhidna lutea TaxID=447679 RepID=A0A239FEF5_EKHLU|nr:o-succinylbenzoate--CoA ligase [Ekhidna lutea]SNS54464.1 fatty-acyl-CoA synthase [Ekhidna lutea]
MSFRKDWIERWAEYAPIKVAVSDAETGDSLTYRQLNNLSNFLAKRLQTEGIQPGDRVAVLSEFRLEYIVLLGAAMKLGFIIVPINYRLSAREVCYMVNNCEPKMVISEEKFSSLIDSDELEHKPSISWDMQDLFSELSKVLGDEEFNANDIKDDDPLFIIYTSGTTGFPKGAIYSYKMAFWNAINTQIRLDITSRDHTVICMPPFHTGGWNVLLMPFLLQGGSFTLLRKFDATTVLNLLEDEEATLFMGVPTMLKMMADDESFSEVSLESVRYFIVGGEAMPLPLIELWESKGVPIRQGFGLTEAGPNIYSLHHDDAMRKIGSIGTPNFFVDVKLMKQDGKEAKDEEEGELWLNGPVVTPGYWNNDEATKDAFTDGWFRTGDILVRDEEGYYYVKDRIKNMFISGGENVYPAEVEKLLQTHPSIQEVAVIGVPDDRWGEVGKAIVVGRSATLTQDDILDFCAGKLAKFKIPKHVELVNEIPKTESGKIDRKKLKSFVNT